MNAFVSYIRRENPVPRLKEVAEVVERIGQPYIDDLVDHRDADRHAMVVGALRTAEVFVAVVTDSYPTTVWTRWEFAVAKARGIPRFALLPDGTLVRPGTPDWPWSEAEELAVLSAVDVTKAPPPPPQAGDRNLCENARGRVG